MQLRQLLQMSLRVAYDGILVLPGFLKELKSIPVSPLFGVNPAIIAAFFRPPPSGETSETDKTLRI